MISVVLPTYDAREVTRVNCARLQRTLAEQFDDFEIVVVEDGSQPAQRLTEGDLPEGAVLVRLGRNRGKGYAVRAGMLRATGRVRVFTDIDLPYDLSAIHYAYRLITERGQHAVFGDRSLAASVSEVGRHPVRRATSRLFKKLVSLFVVSGIGDSQCGFKAFSGELAEDLFPLLRVDRFAFDVEIYYVLLKHDVSIQKIPVRLVDASLTSVSPVADGLQMAATLWRIPLNHRLGRYRSSSLPNLENHRYW